MHVTIAGRAHDTIELLPSKPGARSSWSSGSLYPPASRQLASNYSSVNSHLNLSLLHLASGTPQYAIAYKHSTAVDSSHGTLYIHSTIVTAKPNGAGADKRRRGQGGGTELVSGPDMEGRFLMPSALS